MHRKNLGPKLIDLMPLGKMLVFKTALDCFTKYHTKTELIWKIFAGRPHLSCLVFPQNKIW